VKRRKNDEKMNFLLCYFKKKLIKHKQVMDSLKNKIKRDITILEIKIFLFVISL